MATRRTSTPNEVTVATGNTNAPVCGKNTWNQEEDSVLSDAVAKHGERGWAQIATLLPGRIGKQCRDRWFNHLRPKLKKDAWSAEEDRTLFEAQKSLGNRWSRIASELFPGRTDLAVKNRFYSHLRKANRRMKRKVNGNASSTGFDAETSSKAPSFSVDSRSTENEEVEQTRKRYKAATAANSNDVNINTLLNAVAMIQKEQTASLTGGDFVLDSNSFGTSLMNNNMNLIAQQQAFGPLNYQQLNFQLQQAEAQMYAAKIQEMYDTNNVGFAWPMVKRPPFSMQGVYNLQQSKPSFWSNFNSDPFFAYALLNNNELQQLSRVA